ncbi:MAG TPA: Gfo/Idh/MocA family oxidoreductase [Solirubrobacteraceae bacterium]
MSAVRIGLAGYGFGGRYFHAPFLASAAECEFLGVVTSSAERRHEFAERFPGRSTFDSLDHLAAAGAEAVTISTPASTHVELTQQALRLGLAVVCDKPFALDAASARQTVLLSEQLHRPLTIYQNRRWDSDFRTVRKALADGVLGDPVRFESRFERFDPDPGPPVSGGGSLLDFGSHLVDQALVLFGPARFVYAEMHTRNDAAALDDDVFLAVTHARGVRSHLWGSWRQNAPGPRFRVTGTTASYIVVPDMDGQEDLLVTGHSPATCPDWGTEPEHRWGRVFRGGQPEVLPSERGAWDSFYPAFAAAVRRAGPVPVDPWEAVATAEVLDAARESASNGQVIMIESRPH